MSWNDVDPVARLAFLALVLVGVTLVLAALALYLGREVIWPKAAVSVALGGVVGAAKLFTPMPDWAFVASVLLVVVAGCFWPWPRLRS